MQSGWIRTIRHPSTFMHRTKYLDMYRHEKGYMLWYRTTQSSRLPVVAVTYMQQNAFMRLSSEINLHYNIKTVGLIDQAGFP